MLYAGTKLTLGLPVESAGMFSKADVCEVWSPSRNRRVGDPLMITSVQRREVEHDLVGIELRPPSTPVAVGNIIDIGVFLVKESNGSSDPQFGNAAIVVELLFNWNPLDLRLLGIQNSAPQLISSSLPIGAMDMAGVNEANPPADGTAYYVGLALGFNPIPVTSAGTRVTSLRFEVLRPFQSTQVNPTVSVPIPNSTGQVESRVLDAGAGGYISTGNLRGAVVTQGSTAPSVGAPVNQIFGIVNLTPSNLPFGLLGNDFIAAGDVLRKITNPAVSSVISGPFQTFTDNLNEQRSGRGFIEPFYNPARHDVYVFNEDGSVRNTNPINQTCLNGTDYSPDKFNYTGLVFTARTNAPRGHWNGLGSRVGVLLTRQHILFAEHYPIESDNINACSSTQLFNRAKRGKWEQSLSGTSFQPGNGYMVPREYPAWYLARTGRSIELDHPEIPLTVWNSFADIAVQTLKTPFPSSITPFLIPVSDNLLEKFPSNLPVLFINNSWLTASFMRGSVFENETFNSVFVSNFNSPWSSLPTGASLNDTTSMVGFGDSGSIALCIRPEGAVYLGMTLTGSWGYGLNISSNGFYQSCHNPPFSGTGSCTFDNRSVYSTIGNGTGVFKQKQRLAVDLMLADKSWQITSMALLSLNSQKNIAAGDIVETAPNWLLLDPVSPPVVNPVTVVLQTNSIQQKAATNENIELEIIPRVVVNVALEPNSLQVASNTVAELNVIPPVISSNIYPIFVSDRGDDSNAGSSITTPVKTFKRAADIAKQYFSGGGALNVEILIRGGTYRVFGTDEYPIFYLNASYSAPVGKTLTFKAYNKEKVIISGSEPISDTAFNLITSADSMWSRLSNSARQNVYVANLSEAVYDLTYGIPPQWNGEGVGGVLGNSQDLPAMPDLIFNDETMTLARWPNKNSFYTSGFTFGECAQISSVLNTGTNGVYCVDSGSLSNSYVIDPRCVCGSPNPYPTWPLDPVTGLPENEICFVNAIFTYPPEYDQVIAKWTAAAIAEGIWLHGFWKWDWADETYKVVAIDTQARTIEVESKKSQYGVMAQSVCLGSPPPSAAPAVNWSGQFQANSSPRRWFALNVVEELDTPGEYYIDRANKKLYFWPPQAITPTSDIRIMHRAVAGPAVKNDGSFEVGFNVNGQPSRNCPECFPYKGWEDLEYGWYNPGGAGQSRHVFNSTHTLKSLFKFSKVKNVNIEGLVFKDSAGSGIELNLCADILVKNCAIFNMRKDGIAAMGGKNITIDSCDLHDLGRHGIINTGGNRQTLQPANKLVTRCSIKRWGKNRLSYSTAVYIDGCGNTASYNLIADGPRGVSCGGNNLHIHHNHFNEVQTDSTDAGVINVGRNISWFGLVIEHNLFTNCKLRSAEDGGLPGGWYVVSDSQGARCEYGLSHGQTAIFLDDLQSESTIRKNIFYDCYYGVYINGGVQHKVYNNIFIDSGRPYAAATSSREFWDSHLQTNRWAVLNPNNWPWYEGGGPLGEDNNPTATTGYGPYNHPWVTGYSGTGGFDSSSWAGVMPVVDVSSSVYQQQGSHLAQMLNINLATKTATCSANPSVYKNFASKNVLVSLYEASSPASLGRNGVSGSNQFFQNANTFDVSDEITINNLFTAQEKENLNFELTEQKLNSIRTAVPTFQDIEFDDIPSVAYTTGPIDSPQNTILLFSNQVAAKSILASQLAVNPLVIVSPINEAKLQTYGEFIAGQLTLPSANFVASKFAMTGSITNLLGNYSIPVPVFTNSDNVSTIEKTNSENVDTFLKANNAPGYDSSTLVEPTQSRNIELPSTGFCCP